MSRLTALEKSFADARSQILLQPGEGAFKGVVVLPAGEIGDVINENLRVSISRT